MTIGIIGAGASGMAAALAAAEKPENRVILLERHARVGRKLSATGNGRCNLTNLHAEDGGYHGDAPEFAQAALSAFNVDMTLEWFHQLGLHTVAEQSGRVYPYSDQANSVVDVLRFALERNNIQLLTGFEVTKIKKEGDSFRIEGGDEPIFCDRVIVACGGLAGGKLGGSMAGYKLLRSLGHQCTKLRPTLVQLKSDWSGCASLKGVRANCTAVVCRDGVTVSESTGELQFTDYGLSGPVIFEISRDACHGSGTWSCKMDFLPDMDENTLKMELISRKKWDLRTEDMLVGMLHNRLGRVLTHAAGIPGYVPIEQLEDEEFAAVAAIVKNLEIHLIEPMGMDCAQVTAGGIATAEFDPLSMESRLVPGLFACGELLDIDGDCGGYNLQWAWSSGHMAGAYAGGIL